MNYLKSIRQFLVSEDGPTAVEYAVMLAMIIVVCIIAIQAVGTNTSAIFNDPAACCWIRRASK
jgi:pilus assembly protein Flp/PilA